MPEDEEEITDNVLRVIETAPGFTAGDLDLENLLVEDLGFNKETLRELAFAINKDDYFKPLGVGIIPEDVMDCKTVDELVELVRTELNNDNIPARRTKRPGR